MGNFGNSRGSCSGVRLADIWDYFLHLVFDLDVKNREKRAHTFTFSIDMGRRQRVVWKSRLGDDVIDRFSYRSCVCPVGGGDMTEEIQTVKKKRKKKAVVHVSKVSQLGLRSISLCNPGTFATLLDLIGWIKSWLIVQLFFIGEGWNRFLFFSYGLLTSSSAPLLTFSSERFTQLLQDILSLKEGGTMRKEK